MTKSWSSFENQKLLQENWRDFLREEAGFGDKADQFFAGGDKAYGTNTDGGDDEKTFGLDSSKNSESLLNILRQQAPFLEKEEAKLLISIISQVAEDEGIMLELSLKGLNSEQDRVIDADGSAEILSVIAGFNLSSNENRALLKALNQWGRFNSIKFSKPEKPISQALGPEDLPPPSDVEPDGQNDEEEGVASKIKDVGGKIADMASSDAGKALEGTLDGLSLIPGANIPASIGSALVNLAQGEPKEAALSLLSLIPIAGAAGKLGKFGPVLMKLAPAINTFNKARGASGAKEALQVALKKAGTDISVKDLQKASDSALTMYDKLAGIPGIGDQLKSTLGPYVEPLRGAQEFLDTPEPEPFAMPELEPLVPDSEDAIDLDDTEELQALSADPTALPSEAPMLYDKGPGEIYISKIPYPGNHGWDLISDDTWALYRDLNAVPDGKKIPGSGLFAWSPRSEKHPHGVWVDAKLDPQTLSNLPIQENLFERWQFIAGINQRVL